MPEDETIKRWLEKREEDKRIGEFELRETTARARSDAIKYLQLGGSLDIFEGLNSDIFQRLIQEASYDYKLNTPEKIRFYRIEFVKYLLETLS